jgi:hypothetical protein
MGIFLVFNGCRELSKILDNEITPKVHEYNRSNRALSECKMDEVISIVSDNQNELLKNSELGLAHYFKYEHAQSNSFFDKAISIYRNSEDKATIAISNIVTNEYHGEGYDKVFLHNYKAINYLMLGDAESARVEAKNSNIYQIEAEKKLNELKNSNKRSSQSFSKFDKIFNSVNPKHHPYQNPFAYYISALGYVEDGDYDNALIDIRNALKYAPYSTILKEKLSQYQNAKNSSSVELFFDVGKSPTKSQERLSLDMGNGEIRTVSLPAFSKVYKSDVDYIRVVDSHNNEVARTSLLSDIKAIKINEFREKLPSMAYILTKEAGVTLASKALDEKSKGVATIFKVANAVYNQQDISTWSLLPEKILVASFIPKDGEKYKMELVSNRGKVLQNTRVDLSKNNTKNIYRHFLIRNNRFCDKESEQ